MAIRLSQQLGGVAADERGNVAYYAPSTEAAVVARATFLYFAPVEAAWTLEGLKLEQWLQEDKPLYDKDLVYRLGVDIPKPCPVVRLHCDSEGGRHWSVTGQEKSPEGYDLQGSCQYQGQKPRCIEGLDIEQQIRAAHEVYDQSASEAAGIISACPELDSDLPNISAVDFNDARQASLGNLLDPEASLGALQRILSNLPE